MLCPCPPWRVCFRAYSVLLFLLVGFCLPNHPDFTNDYHLSFVTKYWRWRSQHPSFRPPCSLLTAPVVWAPGECNGLCPKDPSLIPHLSFSNSGILIFFNLKWEIFKKAHRFLHVHLNIKGVCGQTFLWLSHHFGVKCGVAVCVTRLNLFESWCHILVRPATFASPWPIQHLQVFRVVSQALWAVGVPLHGSPWWCLFEFLWWPGWAC